MTTITHARRDNCCGGGSGGECAPGEECLPDDYIDPDDCPGCPDGEECLPDNFIDPDDCPACDCPEGAYQPLCYPVTEDDPDTVIGALSPWAYWKMDDASGNPQDSSGNARHATAAHATITYSQAALSTKVGASILLTAGGRINLPFPREPADQGSGAFTFVGLFQLNNYGEGLSANGTVWLTSSHSDTSVHWGLFGQTATDDRWPWFTTNALRSFTSSMLAPAKGDPFVLGIRCDTDGFVQELWINGVPAATNFTSADSYVSQGVDIGRNFGDSFFDMPSMRVSNVACWASRLSDADFVAVQKTLMDAAIHATAWTP